MVVVAVLGIMTALRILNTIKSRSVPIWIFSVAFCHCHDLCRHSRFFASFHPGRPPLMVFFLCAELSY